ncbi:MAG: hypothetical protein AB8G22_25605 [Saprospiraceae bacterium]
MTKSLLLLLLLFGCNRKTDDIKYVVFYEVDAKENINSGEISLTKIRDKFSDNEIKLLEKVLNELDWGYKLTTDSCVMIYSHYVDNIEQMYVLNNLWQVKLQE